MFNLTTLTFIPLILIFFLIPISTGGANVAYFIGFLIGLACIVFCKNKKNLLGLFPAPALGFFLYFILMGTSLLWGEISGASSYDGLNKYFEILSMPILMYLFAQHRKIYPFALMAFLAAMGLTLFFSYIQTFDNTFFLRYFSHGSYLIKLGGAEDPTVFKWHITHNFFMAFACLLWGYFSIYLWSRQRFLSIISCLFCLFSLINIFYMVQGRIGYLVIFFAGLYLFIHRYGLKGFFYGLFASVLFGLALSYSSDNFYTRVFLVISEALNWNQTIPSDTSIGLRIEFIFQSIKISLDHLIFGVGVGNFKYAYALHVSDLNMITTTNPHNQYILILVEMGIVGLCSFLYLNYLCWASANELNSFWKHSTRIVILCYGVANIFNSFLFDFSESLFFSAFMALAFSQLIHKKSEISS